MSKSIERIALPVVSPGTVRHLTIHRYGKRDARPKAYLQAAVHADETPGLLVQHHFIRMLDEAERKPVAALVFVGDCVEEDIDRLGHLAGQLGLRGVPCFMFHEGQEPTARSAFQQIARLSGGAYCPFDINSAQQLRDLLSAVAVFAAGGRKALADYSDRKGGVVRQLTHQVK